MPLEIEIKLKLQSHDAVLGRLKELGARHAGVLRETNVFFDRPDGSLRRADSGLRVRFTTPLPPAQGASATAAHEIAPPEASALLTFKGPASVTGLRSREAFDLHLTPADQIVPLLEALGFAQLFLFEKNRDSWQMGGCQIELDVLPHFGAFLEIEGPSEEAVRDVQNQLSLAHLPAHRQSYAHMVGDYLRERHEKELRFS